MSEQPEVVEQIREQGYRMTPQRQIVLDAVEALGDHATAGEVYDWVAERAPAVNRATVYRVLNFLCDLELVARFEDGANTMYEFVGERPHHHLVCRACGSVAHLPDHTLDDLAEFLAQEYGFRAELRHLAISGLCRHCFESQEDK